MKLSLEPKDVLPIAGEGCAPDETIESLRRAMIEWSIGR